MDHNDARVIGVEFLRTELRLTRTFLRFAREAGADLARRARNLRSAELTFDTLVRYLPRVPMNREEARELRAGLHAVRKMFSALVPRPSPR
jgi:hypothetical protein